MTRWSFRLALAVVMASLAGGVAAVLPVDPPSATATGVLTFENPVTDNYKSWHPRNGVPINASSFLFTGVAVGGTTYVVPETVRAQYGTPLGAPTEWDAQGGIPLATSPGGETVARLKFDHNGANAWSYFRLWPDGTFGPVMTVNRPAFVTEPHTPVTGTFTVRSTGGATLATREVSYRYDAAIAALPESSSEWNGPFGRWHLTNDTTLPTPLNWPAGLAISDEPSGSHMSSIEVPAGQATTIYVAAADIAGLPIPRVDSAIDLAWNPAGAGRPTSAAVVPAAWRPVSVTLPQGSYSVEATGVCATACRYDYAAQPLTSATSSIEAASAPQYKPDAAARTAGGSWVGEGVFNTNGAGQGVSAAIPLGASREFEVKVTNAGTVTDVFGLAAARGGAYASFDVTWRYQGVDVTSDIEDEGWFVLADVPVNGTRTLQVTVTARPDAAVGATSTYGLHAYHSPASANIKDVVAFQLSTVAATGGYARPAGAPAVPIQSCSRWASPTGNDANPGTQASPVLSLNRLTTVLAPGQTGCLVDGSTIELPATGGLGIMKGGTPGQPKIIRPATVGARATVRGLGKFLVSSTQSDLIIMDIDFRGSDSAGGGNLVQVDGDRVMLDGVDISWPRNICLGVGSSADPAEDFVLIDSRVHDCGTTHLNDPNDVGGSHGVYLAYVRDGADADSWGAIVYNSLLDHNKDRGLQLYPDVDNALVDRVVIYGNGANLNVGSQGPAVRSEGNQITNSIIANSRLDFDDPDDPNPSNTNDVVGNFPGGGHNGANNKIIDSCLSNTVRPGLLFAVTSNGNSLALQNVTQDQPPTFVNVAARDFRLTSGSTCQGKGLADITKLPPRSVPSAPRHVSAVWLTGTSARVTFTPPASSGGSPITNYNVHCTSTDGGTIRGQAGTASPLTVTALTAGKTYQCRARANNSIGTGPFSAPAAVSKTVPGSPRGVTAVWLTSTSARVSFTAPLYNGGSPITSYNVHCTSTDGGIIRGQAGAASPLTVTSLTAGKTYQCRARANNAIGTGPFSALATAVKAVPGSPRAVTASRLSATSARVSFTAPLYNGGSPVTSYNVHCTSTDGGIIRGQAGAASPLTVTSLTAGKTYQCRARANNAIGTGPFSALAPVT